jgi:hypothetical protein
MALGLLLYILFGVAMFVFLISDKRTLQSWLDLPWYRRGDFFFLAPLLRRFASHKKEDPKN